MDPLILARWQFAITTIYHFFFVPLTLGLSVLVAVMQTIYVRTGDETWKRLTKFWGKLLLINFALGVATGIVQEFQFGMNWSGYSRFVGDIFGAPLAIEALLAFFLESTFLGVWIFGWERLSKKVHLASIWLVAIGSNLSALWILMANSFMQEPVGYRINELTGRAEMVDFGALIGNPHVWLQWPHVFFSGLTTAAFFMLGIVAWRLVRREQDQAFVKRAVQVASVAAIIGTVGVIGIGHAQTQYMIKVQPMKIAAAEALWERDGSLSLFSIPDVQNRRDLVNIRVPELLSILAFNRTGGTLPGINELEPQFVAQYGAGNYVPNLWLTYWSFRAMVGAGFLMLALAAWAIYRSVRKQSLGPRWLVRLLPLVVFLPYLANTTGWILTEMGRQPWIVYGVLKTEDAVSPNVPAGMVLASLLIFTLLYAVLMAVDVYLLAKYARADTRQADDDATPSPA